MERFTMPRSMPIPRLRIHMVDWAALTIFAFEVPSLYFSLDRANSIYATRTVTLAVLAYFVLRVSITAGLRSAWLSAIIGVAGACLALSGIHQFWSGSRQLASVGLTDLVAFRAQLMHPIPGWVSGEALTVLLISFFSACAAAVYVWRASSLNGMAQRVALALVPALLIGAALCLSQSRSIFWSAILFLLITSLFLTAYRVISLRLASLLFTGALATLIIVLACDAALYRGIFKAYAGVHVSQVRSTQGRLVIWERSLDLVRHHRMWGVGSSNVALSLLSSADQEETSGFASRTFSLPIQILTEKGLIGFAVYSAFLFFAFWEFHRGMRLHLQSSVKPHSADATKQSSTKRSGNRERDRLLSENADRAMKCCFAAGLVAILIRELTYSSLLEHSLTLALFFALIACMCSTANPGNLKIKPIVIIMAIVVLFLQWPFSRYDSADANLKDFYSQVLSANFAAARKNIDEAIRLWPWNARYYAWRAYLTSQELPSQCLRQSMQGSSGLSGDQKRLAEEAIKDYRHSLTLNSRDAVARHNLAWLEHLLGDDVSAETDLQKSIEIDPDIAVFHLSYGMFLEEHKEAQEAQAQYESAIELKPSIVDSPFFVRYGNRTPAEADAIVKQCIEVLEARLGQTSDPILEARLGEIYLYMGSIERSAQFLNAAARQMPNLPLVWFNLGEVSESKKDLEQALIDYRRALKIDPSLASAYLRTGEIELRNGRKEAAIYDLRMAQQRWERINPITAAHNNRLYGGPRQAIDDLLPTTLVWFISPCASSEAMTALSQMFPQNREYAVKSKTCEEIPSPHSGTE
jgi:tetratricopeptide (TPR) repeat protein